MPTSHRRPCRPPRRDSSVATGGRWRVLTSLAILVPTLVGCGGGGTTQTTAPPEDPAPAPVLDFSAIAGEWTGSGEENNGTEFSIDATIEAEAVRGDEIGIVEYRAEGFMDCENRWLASDAEDPVYVVREVRGQAGNCPPGTVTLERFGDDELLYEYTPDNGNQDIAGAGTLTRK